MSQINVTRREMLAVASARCINNGDVVFIGFGLPMIAALLDASPNTCSIVGLYFFINGTGVRCPIKRISRQ